MHFTMKAHSSLMSNFSLSVRNNPISFSNLLPRTVISLHSLPGVPLRFTPGYKYVAALRQDFRGFNMLVENSQSAHHINILQILIAAFFIFTFPHFHIFTFPLPHLNIYQILTAAFFIFKFSNFHIFQFPNYSSK